jgi:hypothetical protein
VKVYNPFALALFLGVLLTIGCQESQSPVAGGERAITTATEHLDTPEEIAAALDLCNDDGTGQGTAGSTRFLNAIRKLDNGDFEGAKSDIIGLLDWEYDRYDLGKWKCSDAQFEEILTAAVFEIGLDIPITLDGGICDSSGCTLVTNDACTGILVPNPAATTYYVSFTEIPDDPFVAKHPIFNSFPAWADVKVFDLSGNEVSLAVLDENNAATVAIVVEGTPAVAEGSLRLGHLKDEGLASEEVEILPPDLFPAPLTCGATAQAGFFGRFASLFQVSPLYGGGTKSGLMTAFSPVGPIDPHSNTKVGITPTSTTLTDLQSVTLTATVMGVNGEDWEGTVYTATPIPAGDALRFVVDGVVWGDTDSYTNASGKAALTLTCGDELDFGEHEIGVEYHATDTHAESSTGDQDSPTGVATVNCTTPFNVINFDRDPNNNPLKNGEIINDTYAPLGVTLSHVPSSSPSACINTDVFAVSDPNTGNFGSPPRVVSLCPDVSPISSSTHGWVEASFEGDGQSEVCIAVFPTGKGKTAPMGKIVAYDANGDKVGEKTGQGTLLCVTKSRRGEPISRVIFSGDGTDAAKFDNLRYR